MSDSVSAVLASGKLVGAAARGYEILSSWEQSAPLDSEQLALIDLISKHCQERPLPAHLRPGVVSETPQRTPLEDSTRQEGQASTGDALEMDGVVLHTTQQFYKWYGKLEAVRLSETEEEYKDCAKQLKRQLATCKEAKELIHDTLITLEEIVKLHKDAVGRSKALRETGERLVEEQNQLSEFAAAVRSRLLHFDELESIAAEFHSIATSMDSSKERHNQQTIFQRFLTLLKKIDECISYMTANPHFAEAQAYESRFRQLHSRAVAGILHRVNEILRSAVQELEPEITIEEFSEGEETNLFYIKFVALVEEQMKSVLPEVVDRSGRAEYKKLFEDCQHSFCKARVQLLLEVVKRRILGFQQDSLAGLLREGFSYLLQVCRFEHKLFFEFFPEKETPKGLIDLMESLGTVLYDVIRPKLISVSSVDDLCDYVSILKNEIYDGQIENLGDSVDALRSIVMRTLADAQERLIYRAQAFIEEKLVHFEPQTADLNYPGVLESLPSEQGDSWSLQQSCFPPIRATLEYLEKLYTCLDVKIFSGIAHEAVLACSVCITKAVVSISRASSELDGQLFAIRHLLLLREKLVPFRIDFSMTEKDLDFTHMRDHMRRVLSGEVSVFQLPTNNVVQLVTWTAPRITDSQVDSKKQLEKQLKLSSEALITMVTKSIVEPILAFLTKVSALRDSNVAQSGTVGEGRRSLFEHAFASVERLSEIVELVNENLESTLPNLVSKIKLYLPQQSTFSTLFRPMKANIIDAHLQLKAILNSDYKGTDLTAIQLKTKEQLHVILEAM
eukprot:g3124.t1